MFNEKIVFEGYAIDKKDLFIKKYVYPHSDEISEEIIDTILDIQDEILYWFDSIDDDEETKESVITEMNEHFETYVINKYEYAIELLRKFLDIIDFGVYELCTHRLPVYSYNSTEKIICKDDFKVMSSLVEYRKDDIVLKEPEIDGKLDIIEKAKLLRDFYVKQYNDILRINENNDTIQINNVLDYFRTHFINKRDYETYKDYKKRISPYLTLYDSEEHIEKLSQLEQLCIIDKGEYTTFLEISYYYDDYSRLEEFAEKYHGDDKIILVGMLKVFVGDEDSIETFYNGSNVENILNKYDIPYEKVDFTDYSYE